MVFSVLLRSTFTQKPVGKGDRPKPNSYFTMHFNTKKATEFWQWFQLINGHLHSDISNTQLLQKLDAYVSTIGKFEWEVGPLDNGDYYLAISPNLNKTLLPATREIIGLAPVCKGWQFLPAKPAKKHHYAFTMDNQMGKQITVDTTLWKYVLYKYEDNTFCVDIKMVEMDCNDDYCYLAMEIALTNSLCEEAFMGLIEDVKIVTAFENEDKANLFAYLDDHLGQISII